MQLSLLLKAMAFTFVFFVLVHWMTSGQDEIVKGPPETPDVTFYQPSPTP